MLGLAPAFAFDGTTRPPADAAPGRAACRAGISRAVQVDVPRPPASIPRAGGVLAPPPFRMPHCRGRPRRSRRCPRPARRSVDRPLPPPTAFAAPAAPITPFEAFRSGARALRDGQKEKALVSLEYAAEQGVVAAQWKLGRMYAEGDGVDQSDMRAFEYFSRIADGHADDNPGTPQARYVANAFVSLGHYYREGIANSDVRADLGRARQMYAYAASYFGDPDAQYHLARLMLDGVGRPAIRGRRRAGCTRPRTRASTRRRRVLGRMLFKGETACRVRPARGLMWLTLARANAGAVRWLDRRAVRMRPSSRRPTRSARSPANADALDERQRATDSAVN